MKILGDERKKTKKNRFIEFLLKHKVVVFLVVVIGLLLLYFDLKIKDIEFTQIEMMRTTNQIHNRQIDSIQISGTIQTIKVFSWAVRGELIRDNIDQVNQLFQAFIKENEIQQIDLINPESSVIFLSTDMKQEGQKVSDEKIIRVNKPTTIKDSLNQKVIIPVMGLEKRIGVLVIKIGSK